MPLSKKETERKHKNFEKCTLAYRIFFRHVAPTPTREYEVVAQANTLFKAGQWQRAMQILHANGIFRQCIRVRQWTGHRKTDDADPSKQNKVRACVLSMMTLN